MPTRLTRDQQQELTRQRLLDAALGVFRTHGFAATTVEEIAELAGYSRGALYSHFGSKEALYIELLEVHSPSQFETFRRAIEAATVETTIVDAIVEAFLPAAENARGRLVDTLELAAKLGDKPDLAERMLVVQQAGEDLMGWCAGQFCRLRGLELVAPERQVGLTLLAFVSGLAQRRILEPGLEAEVPAAAGVIALIEAAAVPVKRRKKA